MVSTARVRVTPTLLCLRQAAQLVSVEAKPSRRRELTKGLRQVADELVSVEANFCNVMRWPMLSSKLLSWVLVRPNVSWPILSGQLVS